MAAIRASVLDRTEHEDFYKSVHSHLTYPFDLGSWPNLMLWAGYPQCDGIDGEGPQNDRLPLRSKRSQRSNDGPVAGLTKVAKCR